MTEVEALIEDLGLIPLSSPEAQECLRVFREKDIHASSFEDCYTISNSYPDLLNMYAKYNSKGCKRSFGCAFEYQLTLF